jgi:hypothetical protein
MPYMRGTSIKNTICDGDGPAVRTEFQRSRDLALDLSRQIAAAHRRGEEGTFFEAVKPPGKWLYDAYQVTASDLGVSVPDGQGGRINRIADGTVEFSMFTGRIKSIHLTIRPVEDGTTEKPAEINYTRYDAGQVPRNDWSQESGKMFSFQEPRGMIEALSHDDGKQAHQFGYNESRGLLVDFSRSS